MNSDIAKKGGYTSVTVVRCGDRRGSSCVSDCCDQSAHRWVEVRGELVQDCPFLNANNLPEIFTYS